MGQLSRYVGIEVVKLALCLASAAIYGTLLTGTFSISVELLTILYLPILSVFVGAFTTAIVAPWYIWVYGLIGGLAFACTTLRYTRTGEVFS